MCSSDLSDKKIIQTLLNGVPMSRSLACSAQPILQCDAQGPAWSHSTYLSAVLVNTKKARCMTRVCRAAIPRNNPVTLTRTLPAGVCSCRCMRGASKELPVYAGRQIRQNRVITQELRPSLARMLPLLCCPCFDHAGGL